MSDWNPIADHAPKVPGHAPVTNPPGDTYTSPPPPTDDQVSTGPWPGSGSGERAGGSVLLIDYGQVALHGVIPSRPRQEVRGWRLSNPS